MFIFSMFGGFCSSLSTRTAISVLNYYTNISYLRDDVNIFELFDPLFSISALNTAASVSVVFSQGSVRAAVFCSFRCWTQSHKSTLWPSSRPTHLFDIHIQEGGDRRSYNTSFPTALWQFRRSRSIFFKREHKSVTQTINKGVGKIVP